MFFFLLLCEVQVLTLRLFLHAQAKKMMLRVAGFDTGEDEQGAVTALLQQSHGTRRSAESMARHLLHRLDRSRGAHTLTCSPSPWDDASSLSHTARWVYLAGIVQTHTHVCTHHSHTHACMHASFTHARSYTYTHLHTHIHTQTHTHTESFIHVDFIYLSVCYSFGTLIFL